MRAYARDLGISKSHLSEILRGKNKLSPDRAMKFVSRLGLNRTDMEVFLDLVELESDSNELARRRAERRLNARFFKLNTMSDDQFTPVSEWYFMPIMELLATNLQDHSAENIGKRLGLTPETAAKALEILVQNNFLTLMDGKYTVNSENTTCPNTPSSVIRNYYHKMLAMADKALEEQPLERRDYSVATMAISREKLAIAKDRIRNFRRELFLELNDGVLEKDAVYSLSICLFELTKDL